jgi:hypothetical protein
VSPPVDSKGIPLEVGDIVFTTYAPYGFQPAIGRIVWVGVHPVLSDSSHVLVAAAGGWLIAERRNNSDSWLRFFKEVEYITDPVWFTEAKYCIKIPAGVASKGIKAIQLFFTLAGEELPDKIALGPGLEHLEEK